MHRFFISDLPEEGDRLELPKAEAHHAASVLRVRQGDEVTVLDGRGNVLLCEVESVARREVSLVISERRRHERQGGAVTLFQSIVKGKAMDHVVQKATELGVSRIVPVVTERTVARPSAGEAEGKREKWLGIAIEAVKQCGSPWLPDIGAPVEFQEALEMGRGSELVLVASLDEEKSEARRWFQEHREAAGGNPETVAAWIGPEGDFTPGELAAVLSAGARPISLGPLVLRADTAAICALAVIGAELRAPSNSE